MKNIYLVAIICNKKIRSGTKYGATVGMVGDGKQLLFYVELPDIGTRGTVEAEQEGLVRGHVPRGLHLLGLDTAVHLLDLDMMDHVLQLRIAPSLILSL